MQTNKYYNFGMYCRATRRIAVIAFVIFGAVSAGHSQENTLPDNGNVGIGTTDPIEKLQVNGSAKIDSSLVVDDSLHVKNTLTVNSTAHMGSDVRIDGDLYLTSLTTPDVYPDPLNFLFIDENYTVREGYFSDVSDVLKNLLYAPPLGASQPGFNYCKQSYTLNPYWMGGPNKLYVPCPDVKVGIGTDAPAYHLDNRGNSKFGLHAWFSSTASIGADDNNFARLYVNNPSSGAGLQISNGSTGAYGKLLYMTYTEPTTEIFNVKNTAQNFTPFLFTGNGSMTVANSQETILKLESTGKFTLTSNGQKTFQVETNGLIRARRAKIDLDNWADYVFAPTYRLRSLPEVEAYVKAEKHLPGIPSEKQLIEEGMDVAEMNRLLMEKVEELTLYLIEQNKQIAELQEQVKALNATVVAPANK